jgi:hypothetical protein
MKTLKTLVTLGLGWYLGGVTIFTTEVLLTSPTLDALRVMAPDILSWPVEWFKVIQHISGI